MQVVDLGPCRAGPSAGRGRSGVLDPPFLASLSRWRAHSIAEHGRVEVLWHRGSSLFQLADSHVLEVVCMACSSRAGEVFVSLSVQIFEILHSTLEIFIFVEERCY